MTTVEKEPYNFPGWANNEFIQDFSFQLNTNNLKNFRVSIKEPTCFNYYGSPDNLPRGDKNSKWSFVLQFTFVAASGKTLPVRSVTQCHIIFELRYEDIKGNEYMQMIVFVPQLKLPIIVAAPMLLNEVDQI